jgi:alpha/beta superfamily hydrolase
MSKLPKGLRDCALQVDGLALEARLVVAGEDAGAVVAPPHPLYGGSLHNAVVQAAVQGLVDAELTTLAFNYRGTEGSEGVATDSLEAATADYRAALAELRTHTLSNIVAAGYSFGAGTALLTARDDAQIAGLVLIAPPIGMLHSEDLAVFHGRVLVIVGDQDEYAPVPALQTSVAGHPSATLEVLAGVDHFFHYGGLAAVHTLVRDHVRRWLS